MNVRRDRTALAVVGVTLLALGLRLAFLGRRVAHFDEGRVAYWILEYGETGVLFYRPIIHGPLLHHLNSALFGLFGATDFVMRLVPALVGGLLPLSALLFRHRLRAETVVSLSFLLALNPVLLYYSRFMRGDIIAGGLSFLAFACLVRAVDLDDGRYLYAATLSLALGLGAKENVVAYVLAFLGATGLLLHHRLLFARVTDATPQSVLWRSLRWGAGGVARHARSVAGSVAVFLATVVFVYAPRGSLPSQDLYYFSCGFEYDAAFDVTAAPTLGDTLANPLRLPDLVVFTLGSTAELYVCQWITPRAEDPNPYIEYLGGLVATTATASTALVVLAVAGFLGTLYAGNRPDDLLSFSFYWGAASLVGYPFITDIGGAGWLAVHVVLPLAIPAAVALGVLYRWGREAKADEDAVSLALVGVVAFLVVSSMGATAYETSFAAPQSDDNPLVQYAQPSGDLRPTLSDTRTLADENDGTDVVLYGSHLYNPVDDELERRPTCSNWFNALPLPWYLEAGDVDADCVNDTAALEDALADDPPVVVVHENERAAVDERIDDRYEARVHLMRSNDTPFVFYVDESRLE
ncbi:TIGR03663 family protein [Halobacteriales archaeon QH_10_70_21]|nr:MAG: TIGR03663 family protein [Halobacteriales archaeon QH_10_70_21]